MIAYRVRHLDAGRAFFCERLRFEETDADPEGRWVHLRRGDTDVELSPGEPDEASGVAIVEVEDVKAEAERLRADGVNVGVVLELAGQVRVLDVYDPDGNRIQFTQDLL